MLVWEPATEGGSRSLSRINDRWKFLGGEARGARNPGFDDSGWTEVSLPHTWNAKDAFDDEPGYRRGAGWYRRRLTLNDIQGSEKLFLRFEGANQATEVFVNGRKAGRHVGGYTAFVAEITDLVNPKGDNVVAVRIDNGFDANVPPLDADFNFYGGIYRDAWLLRTGLLHFSVKDHASPGIYVDTPKVSGKSAAVRVRGKVVNGAGEAKRVSVRSVILDAWGNELAAVSSEIYVPAGGEASFEGISPTIPRPRLWSPSDPYLYTVRTELREGSRALDRVESPLGFRWFSFDPEKGFSLNGSPLKLMGASRHQDYRGRGNALPDRLHERDLEKIKDMGANFVRLAHYPQDPAVLDAADRLGLIVWEEIPVVDYITTSKEFARNCETMLTEMIRQHYNHPSVVMWGYMNEVFLKGPEKTEGYQRRVVELARSLDRLAHREDASRVTTMALSQSELYNTSGLADVPDVVGWNIYSGWYGGSFSDFGKFLDEQHRRYPGRVLLVSEYGAGSDGRLHSRSPERFDFTTEYQQEFLESYLAQIKARPYLAGTLQWNMFDFGSESRGDSIPHINQKGLATFGREPKDVFYLYKATLSGEPVLHVASREWSRRTGTDPEAPKGAGRRPVKRPVKVYTNLSQVELFHDGRSLGTRKVDNSRTAVWEVPFRDGINVIEARGRKGSRTVRDRTEVSFVYRAPLLSDPSVPFGELAVNVGSGAQFTDGSGLIWEVDRRYEKGAWGYVGGETSRTDENILGTPEDPLYQTVRYGLDSYRFDVPDGDYEVELRFTETYWKNAGQRVFGVRLNEKRVIRALDVVGRYGALRPASRRFEVSAADGRGLKISFDTTVDNPILSAVRIRKLR